MFHSYAPGEQLHQSDFYTGDKRSFNVKVIRHVSGIEQMRPDRAKVVSNCFVTMMQLPVWRKRSRHFLDEVTVIGQVGA